MVDKPNSFLSQLRDACKLTGAAWAVWLLRMGSHWEIYPPQGISKFRQTALRQLFAQPQTSNWLAGALSSNRVRSRSMGNQWEPLGCQHLYVFPNSEAKTILLVGADTLSKEHRDYYRVLSWISPVDLRYPKPQAPEQVLIQPIGRSLETPFELDHVMTLLIELAMAASGGVDTDEVARTVVRRLRKTFDTHQAAVLLLTQDGKTLLEYGGGIEGAPPLVIPVQESLAGLVIEQMKPMRFGDIRQAPRFFPPSPEVNSALIVPLMYRGGIIGTLCLQSNQAEAFTAQDEELLIVIASHLAGLLEYVRLNQEARERAGKLSLIHQVAQRVVGLADEAEVARVTAELTADYFEYELAVVLLADPGGETLMAAGVGGRMAHLVPRDFSYPVTKGITGQVFRKAKGGYYNDVSLNEVYFPLPAWQAGSEMCVPLMDGDNVFGVINVERAQHHSFSDSDLQVLESLAGILSSVILSARRYQELQERIEALHQAENRLIRSARLAAVGEMAAGVAHELNNPLTSVIGFVELALDDVSKDKLPSHEDLDLAFREAQRAREVVRRLLDFSRQSGNIFVASDLNGLSQDVLRLMQHQAETGGVQIIVEFGDLPLIQVNPNQIKQVVINLFQNALQAMPDGGILTLRTGANVRGNERWVFLSISDTGEGVQPEYYERIFEPFFTTRPVGKGTGLGLSVSYGIISSHGGNIEVNSQAGHGSCFTVWLPVQ